MTTKPAATASTWKAKMEERRQNEESKVRAAAVAVNDISFPALPSAGGGWAAPSRVEADKVCYSGTLKAKMAAMDSDEYVATSSTAGMSTRDQAAALAVFRHPGRAQFGTSRSSQHDTYYDSQSPNSGESSAPPVDGEWTTIDSGRRKAGSGAGAGAGSHIDYTEDVEGDGGDVEDDEPNSNW